MSPGSKPPTPRITLLDVARGAFLVAAVSFGLWGFRSHRQAIVAALAHVSPIRFLTSCALVTVGLVLTWRIWHGTLRSFGHAIPARPSARVFFVGQLGKYIPGSVWTLGAQAEMARSYSVPVRTTVAVGLLFLWIHLLTAIPVAGLTADLEAVLLPSSNWLAATAIVVGVVGLSPPVLSWVGERLARSPEPLRVHWGTTATVMSGMGVVWLLYGLAATLVTPSDAVSAAGGWRLVIPVAGAYAMAYIVGVVVVIAPAGLGAREGVLVALLAGPLGVPAAVATALLIRLVHTICDFSLAWTAWLRQRAMAGRGSAPDQGVIRSPIHHRRDPAGGGRSR